MKATFAVPMFEKYLRQLVSVIDSKSTIPVLQTVSVNVAEDGNAVLAGTDLSAAMKIRTKAEKVDKPGQLLLPVKRLLQIMATLNGGLITLAEGKNSSVSVTAGSYKGTLTSHLVSLYPEIDAIGTMKPFSVNLPSLKLLASRVLFAIPQDALRSVPSSALIESGAEKLVVVGTDGHRLPVASLVANIGLFKYIIPKRTLSLLNELDGEVVNISETDSGYFFATETHEFSVRKSSGQFPPYQSVIPKTFTTTVTVKADVLKGVIARATTVADSKKPAIAFSGDQDGTELRLEAVSVEAGSSVDSTPATIVGPAFRTGLNADYVNDFLGQVEGDIKIQLQTDGSSAVQFSSGDNYICVIMPTKLD